MPVFNPLPLGEDFLMYKEDNNKQTIIREGHYEMAA
jgi:hypothetical protein